MSTKRYVAYFDGACGPRNPGGTPSYGIVITENTQTGPIVFQHGAIISIPPGMNPAKVSNNFAEYHGLSAVLDWFENNGLQHVAIDVRGDSMLVIKQMFGTWRIKRGAYADVARSVKARLPGFPRMRGRWVPREKNRDADRMSKLPVARAEECFTGNIAAHA